MMSNKILALVAQVLLCLVAVNSQDFGHCTEEDANNFLSDQGRTGNLRVKLASTLAEGDFCAGNIRETPIDYAQMSRMCRKFCAPGMPIVIGTETVGFGLEDVNSACAAERRGPSSLLVHDPDLVSNCALWGRSIDRMARSAANVVGSARELEYEQLLYRTRMQAQAAELKAAMLEPTFTSEMQSKRHAAERVDEIRRTISQFMSRLMRGGSDQVPLTEAVGKLTETARALNRSVNEEVANLENYVEQCAELMTGQGPLGEYLLDICAVSGRDCIQGETPEDVIYAFHSSCCCGIIPAAGMDGIGADMTPMSDTTTITTTTTTTTTSVASVCWFPPWRKIAGDCWVDSDTHCINSPNYPGNYGNSMECTFHVDREAQFVVQNFAVEKCCDGMEVNSQWYSHAPYGLVPSLGTYIHWASDGSVTDSGWRICPLDCMARRLQDATTIQEEERNGNVNVCGLAYQMSNGNIAQKINEMAALPGGPDQIAIHEASQTAAYPEFYGDVCRTVELSEPVFGRKLQDNDTEPNVFLQGCRLPTTTSEIEQPSGGPITLPIKVGGWAGSAFQCQDATWLDDDALADTCQAYCGDTLPLILGHSRSWGLAQERMDQVCLQPDSSVDGIFNQSRVDVCHERAVSFHLLKQRIADFVSKMEVLQATQTLFKGRTQRLFETLNRELGARSQGELDRADTTAGAKIAAFKLLVHNIIDEQTGSTEIETDDLKEALQDMVSAATTLQATLSTVLPEMQAFLRDCNFLTTGTGANDDYLLDMCTQTGQQCIDAHDEVRHVGCCCAYNPIVKLGLGSISSDTIPGITNMRDGRVEVASQRRLQSSETYIDICATAESRSQSRMHSIEQSLEDIGRLNLFNDLERDRQHRYPEFSHRCAIDIRGPPPTTTQRPPTTTQRPTITTQRSTTTTGGPADGGPADGGPADGGPADGGPAEGGPADGGPADGGPAEGGPADGGPANGGPADGSATSTEDSNAKKYWTAHTQKALLLTVFLIHT